MRFEAKLAVSPRAGIANPEGATIERALPALGFDTARDVRVGKIIRLEIEADSADAATAIVEDMCGRFLSNPVIEDTTVEILNP